MKAYCIVLLFILPIQFICKKPHDTSVFCNSGQTVSFAWGVTYNSEILANFKAIFRHVPDKNKLKWIYVCREMLGVFGATNWWFGPINKACRSISPTCKVHTLIINIKTVKISDFALQMKAFLCHSQLCLKLIIFSNLTWN